MWLELGGRAISAVTFFAVAHWESIRYNFKSAGNTYLLSTKVMIESTGYALYTRIEKSESRELAKSTLVLHTKLI